MSDVDVLNPVEETISPEPHKTKDVDSENVETMTLPVQAEDAIKLVKENLNIISDYNCEISLHEDGSITLQGTSTNVANCFELLQSMFGVTDGSDTSSLGESRTESLASAAPTSNGPSVDVVKPSSSTGAAPILTLKELSDQDADHSKSSNEDDDSLMVEELLWKWIQKDEEAKREVDGVFDECSVSSDVKEVSGEDEELYGRSVRLVLTGGDQSTLNQCKAKVKQVVVKYESSLERKKGVCSDEGKIKKYLPVFNRTPCLVVLHNKTVTIVGKKDDVKICAPKLSKYGVSFEGLEEASGTKPASELKSNDGKGYVSGAESAGGVNQMGRFTGAQPYRQGPPQGLPGGQMMGPRGAVPSAYSDAGTSEYEALAVQAMMQNSADGKSATIPLPKILWMYIWRCKTEQLKELRDGYGVNVEVAQDDQTNFDRPVLVKLSAESEDVLDCGRMAFLQLVESLQMELVVQQVPVKFGSQGMRDTEDVVHSEQLLQMFEIIRRECSTDDSMVECTMEGIFIMAPNHKAQEAQERVVNFLKNLTQMSQGGPAGAGGLPPGMMSQGGFPGQGHLLGGRGDRVSVPGSGPVIKELPDDDDKTESDARDTNSAREVNSKASKPTTTATGAGAGTGPASVASADGKKEKPRTSSSGTTEAGGAQGSCSACSIDSQSVCSDEHNSGNCGHAYCLSCIEMYFGYTGLECPTCGLSSSNDDQSGSATKRTQPADGRMLVNEDSSFHLPGFEKTSTGTLVVTYMFPPGVQSDDMPAPGQKYDGSTKTAFLPKNGEGSKVLNLLRKAFDKRILFTYEDGQLAFNGIRHKVNIYGGPQQSGYPDPVYLRRVITDLLSKGVKL